MKLSVTKKMFRVNILIIFYIIKRTWNNSQNTNWGKIFLTVIFPQPINQSIVTGTNFSEANGLESICNFIYSIPQLLLLGRFLPL